MASEFSTGNSCFESAALTISDDAPGATSDYTFSQEIAMDGTFDLGLSAGASISMGGETLGHDGDSRCGR